MSSRDEIATRRPRLPTTPNLRHTAYALLASVAGLFSLAAFVPPALSALLLAIFVGVGPGSAFLAWIRPVPVSRLIFVPALGLAFAILVTGAAATLGWWAPNALFGFMALCTVWSVVPNVPRLVRDMVP
jgi:hypothetical protein